MIQKGQELGFTPDQVKVISMLRNEGFLDPNAANEVTNMGVVDRFARQRGKKILPQAISSLGRSINNVGSGMISLGEEYSRINTVMMLLDAFSDPTFIKNAGNSLYKTDPMFSSMVDGEYGGDKYNTEALAKMAIMNTHGAFNASARPLFLQSSLGAALFPLVGFPVQLMENLGRMAFQRGGAGVKGIAMLMGMLFLYGGAKALPLFSTFDWIYKLLQKMMGNQVEARGIEAAMERGLAELGFNDSITDMIVKGPVFSSLGIEASARISPSFFGQNILETFLPSSQGFGSSGGPDQLYGMFSSFVGAARAASTISQSGDQSWGEAFIRNGAIPASMGDILKGVNIGVMDKQEELGPLTTGRIETQGGNTLLKADSPAWGESRIDEAAKQLIGFNPTPVAEARMLNYITTDTMANLKTGASKFNRGLSRQLENLKNATTPEAKQKYQKRVADIYLDMKEYTESLPPEYRRTWDEQLKLTRTSVGRRMEEEADPQMLTGDKRLKAEDLINKYSFGDLEKAIKDKPNRKE
jgi:hypothetical protein